MKAWFPFLFLFLVLSLPVMCADPPGQDKKIQNCFGLTLNGTALRLNDKWEPPEGAELVGTKDAPGLINIKWMRNIFGDGLLAYEFTPDNPFGFVKDNKLTTIYHYVIYILPKNEDQEKNHRIVAVALLRLTGGTGDSGRKMDDESARFIRLLTEKYGKPSYTDDWRNGMKIRGWKQGDRWRAKIDYRIRGGTCFMVVWYDNKYVPDNFVENSKPEPSPAPMPNGGDKPKVTVELHPTPTK